VLGLRGHDLAFGEGEAVGDLTDGAIACRQGDDPAGEWLAVHQVKATHR
jgi:hypothetical protein